MKENVLGKDKISSLVLKIAIPSMLAQFISVLYSIVDRIFVNHIGELGSVSLQGIGVCAPILTFIGAFSVLIGIGGGPLLGIALGEKNKDKARKILANAFLMLIGVGIIVSIIAYFIREPMLKTFGATDAIYPFAEQYFSICLIGVTFLLLSQGLYQFVIAQGYAKTGMFSIALGAIINIALDPVFIYVLKLGIAGAAWATIISQFCSALFIIIFLFTKSDIKITFKGYSFKTMLQVMKLGVSPFLIIALDSGLIIAVNAMLKETGGVHSEFLIEVNTIVQSFMLLITMPLGGISGGTQCILAYNYGAGNTSRVMEASKRITKLCLIYTTFFFIFARAGGEIFVKLFTSDPETISASMYAIKLSTMAIIPLGIQYSYVDGFTGIGQVKISLFLSLWRKAWYFIAVFSLPFIFNAFDIFYAETISDIFAFIMVVPMYNHFMKKIVVAREQYVKENNILKEQTTEEVAPVESVNEVIEEVPNVAPCVEPRVLVKEHDSSQINIDDSLMSDLNKKVL